jgi:hypothetical protein
MKNAIDPIIFGNGSGFLSGVRAAVVITDSRNMFSIPDSNPIPVPTKETNLRGVVPWGANNNLPQDIIDKVAVSPDLSVDMLFNVEMGYGDGIVACRYEVDDQGNRKVIPVYDNIEINAFFESNDINGYLLEQLTDLNFFYNIFPEIILNQDDPDNRKVVYLTSKEAAFSRWEEMNPENGKIEHHFYSAKWPEGIPDEKNLEVTEVLDFHRPITDILQRIGRDPRKGNNKKDDKVYRYIVPVNFPTPGRPYYRKPYWYSIIESGWYDFAVAIPEFKKYLIQNGMTIRYVIYLSDDYFPDIFAREGIREVEAQKARVKKEYEDLNKYLTGLKNTGKSMVSFYRASPDGKKMYRIEIQVVENKFKGGEYLEDSGEVSNMIAYTMGVHPSLIGAVPGSNKGGFSGSDKRELFIIKQALLAPIRERILRPLYLVKRVNKWPEDIHFAIPNITLTTLDKNKTGTENVIQPT